MRGCVDCYKELRHLENICLELSECPGHVGAQHAAPAVSTRGAYSPWQLKMYVDPLAGVALNVSVMLPVVAVFSPVMLATAPVPPTILQMKMGVSGQVFVKLVAIVGFAATVPLAVTVAVNRWLVPLAVTVAELPHPLESVMFDAPIELPRFASRKIPCTFPA
jgi:hypothetical protein